MAKADFTDLTFGSVEEALEDFRTLGRDEFLRRWGRGKSRDYFVLDHFASEKFDAKAILGAAHEFDNPGSNLGDGFYGGMETLQPLANAFDKAGKSGQFSVSSIDHPAPADYRFPVELRLVSEVEEEVENRLKLYREMPGNTSPKEASPSSLKHLGIYRGAAGVWVDKKRTRRVAENEAGITVSVLHTGSSYPDDLTNDGLIYHYPNTDRPPARDAAEIEATKEAGRLQAPVFVITYPSLNARLRNVFLGWVEGWDDAREIFLITFDAERPSKLIHEVDEDEEPFQSTDSSNKSAKQQAMARPGQQRFRFKVRLRYGDSCLLCGVNIPELLDAAHIRPKKYRGSDDPRNGLLLCSLHHRAFDAQMLGIEPVTLRVRYINGGPGKSALKVEVDDLQNLLKKPHTEALEWLWRRWSLKHIN